MSGTTWEACDIRLRAERKCGELVRQREKAKGSPGNQYTGPLTRDEGSKTLADLVIDRLTNDDVAYNCERMRRGGGALLRHADALEAWNSNRSGHAA